ncbi:hypothetical protein [Microbulbifer sp. SAOS-129_SWC]|uniref:hypothetical protein n=1 Tax=Microbulbifer sp. SAOS-129_SWC TaxID=3145235 RepID=UPI00321690FB
MTLQRRSAVTLLQRQKTDLSRRLRALPLPAVMGLAVLGGFVAQRLSHRLPPSRLLHLYLTARAF